MVLLLLNERFWGKPYSKIDPTARKIFKAK
jgi:hypothetical protein